jgi:hypothetical protein
MDAYTWTVQADNGSYLAVGITDDRSRARDHVEHLLATEPRAELGTEQHVIMSIETRSDTLDAWPAVGQMFLCMRTDTRDSGFRWSALTPAILASASERTALLQSFTEPRSLPPPSAAPEVPSCPAASESSNVRSSRA